MAKKLKLGEMSLFGKSQLAQDKFRAFLLARNPATRSYVAGLVNRFYEQEATWGVRADLLLCQMMHETGYMTSWWSQAPRRNLCGLGVTGEIRTTRPAESEISQWAAHPNGKWYKGLSFATFQAASQAHYAHMWAYVGATMNNSSLDARAAAYDPRFKLARDIVKARGWKITKLSDLNQRWAVPGLQYAQNIHTLYNTIAASKLTLRHEDMETEEWQP